MFARHRAPKRRMPRFTRYAGRHTMPARHAAR